MFALGIPHVGERTARLLARQFGTFVALRAAAQAAAEPASEAYAELTAIGGIGEVVADALVEFFREPRNEIMLDALLREVVPSPSKLRPRSLPWPARRSSSPARSSG